jgi:hypothetical protein
MKGSMIVGLLVTLRRRGLLSRLAGTSTTVLSSRQRDAGRMDGPLFRNERRLRLVTRSERYIFCRLVCGRHDDGDRAWRNGAERDEADRVRQPKRGHCRRSDRVQLAVRHSRFWRRSIGNDTNTQHTRSRTASDGARYHDNIVRVGLNPRFGPRPSVVQAPQPLSAAYGSTYEFLPSVAMSADKERSAQRPQPPPVVAENAARRLAPVANESKFAKPAVENLDKVENANNMDRLSAEPKPIKHSSKEGRQKNENESERLRRIIAICAGC